MAYGYYGVKEWGVFLKGGVMKRFLLFSIVFIVCSSLTGCAFLRQDTLRAQGKHIVVVGGWGYVDATNAAITITGSTEGTNFHKKDQPTLKVTPSIQEMGPVPINIGKPIDPSEMMQPDNTSTTLTTPIGSSTTNSFTITIPSVPEIVTDIKKCGNG